MSSCHGQGNGTGSTPPPAQPPRRTTHSREYRSIVRLVVAEAEQAQLTHTEHARQIDDLFITAGRMTHRQRLARLTALGERTDDLQLAESTR